MASHPCLTCGACCGFFRVLFHPSEKEPASFHVPSELTVEVSEHVTAMKGTQDERPRCIALSGTIGERVACTIYERRPGCCRKFKASFENGYRYRRCDKARMARGLKPLTKEDWLTVGEPPGHET
jgi:Fe-S-cluster containining protein